MTKNELYQLNDYAKNTAKQQFDMDLQNDKDYIKFKSDAKIKEPNPYFFEPWYKKKKNDDGYNYFGSYGTPNATRNDPFINAKDFDELDERLKPSMGAGAYVKDFKKSKAPQFKGKSKAKKQDMAVAAYLSAKKK